jgi:hypothetical protein
MVIAFPFGLGMPREARAQVVERVRRTASHARRPEQSAASRFFGSTSPRNRRTFMNLARDASGLLALGTLPAPEPSKRRSGERKKAL